MPDPRSVGARKMCAASAQSREKGNSHTFLSFSEETCNCPPSHRVVTRYSGGGDVSAGHELTYTLCSQMSCWHSGHAYTIRRSASNEMKPPRARPAHAGQMEARETSMVAILSARPVRGSGKVTGVGARRCNCRRPSRPRNEAKMP